MSGTASGGIKAKIKNLSKDPDFYKRIGAIGGRNGKTGGFFKDRELARKAGAIGGKISRRRPKVDKELDNIT